MTTANYWNDPEFDNLFLENQRSQADTERDWSVWEDLEVIKGRHLRVEPKRNPKRYAQDELGRMLERKLREKHQSKTRRSYSRNGR